MTNRKIHIKMLPAGNGDAFLLHLGDTNWLIDSGYIKQTYKAAIKPRLKKIAQDGGQLDRLIITHIDSDHISGAVKLLEDNGPADQPNLIPIGQVWHNSYRHIQFADKQKGTLPAAKQKLLRQRNSKKHLSADTDRSGGLVSAKQGSTLAAYIHQGGYSWNADFDGRAVATEAPKKIEYDNGIKLLLLSPDNKALDKLGREWRKKLQTTEPLNEDTFYDDAMEFLMAKEPSPRLGGGQASASAKWIEDIISKRADYNEDTSATNRSSISFLLEYAGKRLLFLGDITPSLVVKRLQEAFPGISKDKPLRVDVLKLSHHGGFTNNSPDLLELVAADHYLISTNGKRHHHPHLQTLAWVVYLHRDIHKQLHFNYFHKLDDPVNLHQERLKKLLDKDLMEHYNYSVILPETDGYAELILESSP